MTAPVFVDTNVFLYAMDASHAKKQALARDWRAELWKTRAGRTSFQVLQEFYVNAVQKLPLGAEEAQAEIRDLLAWRPVAVNSELLERGWRIQERYKFSFWDAMIVAAAKASACRYLLTEDLQRGQNLDGIIVLDPFRDEPASFVTAS